MSESDERRDDQGTQGMPAGAEPEWNTPADELDPAEADELPIAVQRVLASDQHLSERRVFFGHAGVDEPEPEAETEDVAEDGAPR